MSWNTDADAFLLDDESGEVATGTLILPRKTEADGMDSTDVQKNLDCPNTLSLIARTSSDDTAARAAITYGKIVVGTQNGTIGVFSTRIFVLALNRLESPK
jgi:hypothetical protein